MSTLIRVEAHTEVTDFYLNKVVDKHYSQKMSAPDMFHYWGYDVRKQYCKEKMLKRLGRELDEDIGEDLIIDIINIYGHK